MPFGLIRLCFGREGYFIVAANDDMDTKLSDFL